MFNFIYKSIPHFKHFLTTSSTHKLHILQLNHLLSFSSKSEINSSFSVNYFIDKCGFSRERALLASKIVNFNNPDKPDAVISFLKNQGFTETQVFKLISTKPKLVTSDSENTLLPKINFILSQGVSKTDLAMIIAGAPNIFCLNLDRNIIPTFNRLTKLLGSAENTILTLKRSPRLIECFQVNVIPNIETLQKTGVPEPKIKSFLICWPRVLTHPPTRFKEAVEEVNSMGIDPMKSTFFTAITAIISLSKSSWKKKMEVYEKWGCSEDKVLTAFLTNPRCMKISNDKINRIMRYFVNEINWDASKLVHNSEILSYSLNKRIIPRCIFYQVLLSKGFITERSSLCMFLRVSEKKFLKKYGECYEKEVPGLLKLYQEKIKLSVSNIN